MCSCRWNLGTSPGDWGGGVMKMVQSESILADCKLVSFFPFFFFAIMSADIELQGT